MPQYLVSNPNTLIRNEQNQLFLSKNVKFESEQPLQRTLVKINTNQKFGYTKDTPFFNAYAEYHSGTKAILNREQSLLDHQNRGNLARSQNISQSELKGRRISADRIFTKLANQSSSVEYQRKVHLLFNKESKQNLLNLKRGSIMNPEQSMIMDQSQQVQQIISPLSLLSQENAKSINSQASQMQVMEKDAQIKSIQRNNRVLKHIDKDVLNFYWNVSSQRDQQSSSLINQIKQEKNNLSAYGENESQEQSIKILNFISNTPSQRDKPLMSRIMTSASTQAKNRSRVKSAVQGNRHMAMQSMSHTQRLSALQDYSFIQSVDNYSMYSTQTSKSKGQANQLSAQIGKVMDEIGMITQLGKHLVSENKKPQIDQLMMHSYNAQRDAQRAHEQLALIESYQTVEQVMQQSRKNLEKSRQNVTSRTVIQKGEFNLAIAQQRDLAMTELKVQFSDLQMAPRRCGTSSSKQSNRPRSQYVQRNAPKIGFSDQKGLTTNQSMQKNGTKTNLSAYGHSPNYIFGNQQLEPHKNHSLQVFQTAEEGEFLKIQENETNEHKSLLTLSDRVQILNAASTQRSRSYLGKQPTTKQTTTSLLKSTPHAKDRLELQAHPTSKLLSINNKHLTPIERNKSTSPSFNQDDHSFFNQVKLKLKEFDYIKARIQDSNSLSLSDLEQDSTLASSSIIAKLQGMKRRKVGETTINEIIEKEKKDMMRQLRGNFKFMDGFTNKIVVRDEKGIIKNKEWRIDRNINNKILKPTSTLSSCMKTVEDLHFKNTSFQHYVQRLMKRRGLVQQEYKADTNAQLNRKPLYPGRSKNFLVIEDNSPQVAAAKYLNDFTVHAQQEIAQPLAQMHQTYYSNFSQSYDATNQNFSKFIRSFQSSKLSRNIEVYQGEQEGKEKVRERLHSSQNMNRVLDSQNHKLRLSILEKLEQQSKSRLRKSGQLENFQRLIDTRANTSQGNSQAGLYEKRKPKDNNLKGYNPFAIKQEIVQYNLGTQGKRFRRRLNYSNANQTRQSYYQHNQSNEAGMYHTTDLKIPITRMQGTQGSGDAVFDSALDAINSHPYQELQKKQRQALLSQSYDLRPNQINIYDLPDERSRQSMKSDSLSQDSKYMIDREVLDDKIKTDLDSRFIKRDIIKEIGTRLSSPDKRYRRRIKSQQKSRQVCETYNVKQKIDMEYQRLRMKSESQQRKK